MSYTLRDYQEAVVSACYNFAIYREGNGYATVPGGGGKSLIIARLAERLACPVVILARSEKLVSQNHAKLLHPYDAGIYCAGLGGREINKLITVGTIQSMVDVIMPTSPKFLLVDECDEIHPDQEGDSQYWKFIRANGNPRILGFTATPFRTKSGTLSWGSEVINIPISPLIERGFIVPPCNKVGVEVDLSGVSELAGEYNQSQLDAVYEDPELLKMSIMQIKKHAHNRQRNLIFCQSIAHCDAVANALEMNGETAQVVTGDTDKHELSNIILPSHEKGEFKHLINCQLLTVGVDMPWIDMITLLFATKSKRKFEQATYRGTRLYDSKENFLLLDMGNNLVEHGALGSPWTGVNKKNEDLPKKGRICPQCETWIAQATAEECPDCGFIFIKQEPPKVNHASTPVTEGNPYYTGAITSIDDYPVTSVVYKRKKSKAGNDMIVVDYQCGYGKYGTVADFLMPHHESPFMRERFRKFFAVRGHEIPYDMSLSEIDLDQWIHEAENNLKKPSKITIRLEGQYPKIINYEWGEIVAPIPIEEFLDDEIPF
jgi:DNA repair protein RadD